VARKPAAVRFRVRVTVGDVIAIGPGKIELLEAIERTGSITAAAKSLDMSYRRAWLLLDTLNHALREPAVDSARGGDRGGGSGLTDAGRRLVALYRRVERTAASAARRDLERLLAMLAP
jgi:molybdate transport system regulatory protein